MRFGSALGTALPRGARVVASRESAPAYQMIKRAIISGLHSTGVQVADLRTLPAPLGKHHLKTQGYDAAFHVGSASARSGGGPDPPLRASRRRALPGDAEGDREALHAAGAARASRSPRSARSRTRRARVRRTRTTCSRGSTWRRSARAGSGSRSTTATRPRATCCRSLLGPLGVEAVTAHSFEADSAAPPVRLRETIEQAPRPRAGDQRRLRRGLRPLGRARST